MKLPKCRTENCPRKEKDMYVYTDKVIRIGICYACGMFDGTGSNKEALQEMAGQPEMLLDMIAAGQLMAIN